MKSTEKISTPGAFMAKKTFYLAALLSLALFSTRVFAVGSGGFENASFSAKSVAQANAVTAQADEPAAISYNPAGITQLKGIQVQPNAGFISLFTFYDSDKQGSTRSSGTLNMVPTGYVTINPGKILDDRLAVGVGFDSPFGFSNKYDSNHPAVHYTGYKNWLKMFTVKPVVAIKFADWLSVGAGPIYYRTYDFGSITAYPNRLVQQPFGPVPGPPLLNTFPDGQLRLDMSGNSWGWHFGALLKPHKKHQFGFYFRSPTNMNLKGRIKVENATTLKTTFQVIPIPVPPFFVAFPNFDVSNNRAFESGGHTKMNLPLNITVGYAFKPNDRATVEADFGFTRWSTFNRLYINATDSISQGDDAILKAMGKIDTDWRNSFSLQLGGNYRFGKKFTLRGGTHFYWTPVPKTHFRPVIPDSNSLGFSLGAGYQIFPFLNLDLGYYNRFWLRRKIDNEVSEVLGTSVDGTYFSYGQEFILSLTYKWESISDQLFKQKE